MPMFFAIIHRLDDAEESSSTGILLDCFAQVALLLNLDTITIEFVFPFPRLRREQTPGK